MPKSEECRALKNKILPHEHSLSGQLQRVDAEFVESHDFN
jgi:hypothetical protein